MIEHKILSGAAAVRNVCVTVLIALATSGCVDDLWKSDQKAAAANAAPSIQIVPNDLSVMAGGTLLVAPNASDPDGDPLSFGISRKPAWTRFDPATGILSGTPSDSDVGTYDGIVIEVSDGVNRVRAPNVRLVVRARTSSGGGGAVPPPPPANNPPRISGVPATAVVEGQAYSFTPSAADPDGQSLTFSIQNKPGWASFSASTGRLSGTPGAGTAATYSNIAISVSDGSLSGSLPAFSITVQQIATGSATLSWSPPTLRTDGTPLSNLAGYRIHYGNVAGEYSSRITINSAGITTYVVENLGPGTWYFVTTAFDSTGAESDYSNVASKKIS